MALTASRSMFRRVRPYNDQSPVAIARRAAVGLLLSASVGAVVVLLLGGALLAYGETHDGRVFAGVSVAGLDVSGESRAQLQTTLDAHFEEYLNTPIEFQTPAGAFSATPAELGVQVDTGQMADAAYRFGRTGTLWTESRHWLDSLSGGYDVPLRATIDPATFERVAGSQLSALTRAPRDAVLSQASDGHVQIDPGESGLAFDLNSARTALEDRVNALSHDPIEVETIELPPAVTDATLQQALDSAERFAGGTLTLTLDESEWQIDSAALFAMLDFQSNDGGTVVSLDRAGVFANVQAIAHDAYQPGTDATIVNNDGKFVTTQSAPGHRLDVSSSVDAIFAALQQGEREVALVTEPVGSNVTDQDVDVAMTEAKALSSQPITVVWDGGSQTVDADKLAKAVHFDVNPGRNPRVTVTFDEEAMRRALGLVSYNVEVKPVDADLRWINGQVEVRRQEQLGRELDLTATIAAIKTGLDSGKTEIAAVTRDVKPSVTAASAGAVQIREMISSGETYYGDSAENRYSNVELATSRANGELIPPGGVFSFNGAVGEVTTNTGYRLGYGIIGTSNGTISTIPSVGGGICQVATTVFQAAFRAGMPIVERNWHLYWIPRYGSSSSGMTGLDATVDPDYGLDFKFKNTTNDWLAVVSWTDGANVHFELWGTNPGWEVVIDQPVITNVVPATQEMHYEQSDQLPAGQTVFVEHAQDGFDAAIHRVVKKDGQVIDEITLNATYAPAQNTTLVGTG